MGKTYIRSVCERPRRVEMALRVVNSSLTIVLQMGTGCLASRSTRKLQRIITFTVLIVHVSKGWSIVSCYVQFTGTVLLRWRDDILVMVVAVEEVASVASH